MAASAATASELESAPRPAPPALGGGPGPGRARSAGPSRAVIPLAHSALPARMPSVSHPGEHLAFPKGRRAGDLEVCSRVLDCIVRHDGQPQAASAPWCEWSLAHWQCTTHALELAAT